MDDFKTLNEAVINGNIPTAVKETQKALDEGQEIRRIIDSGLIAAMDEVGERFSKGQLFVPQMLRSGHEARFQPHPSRIQYAFL